MKSAATIAKSLLSFLELIDCRPPSPSTQHPTSVPYLKWMCIEIIANDGKWELDKAHRWVGYVQCAIVARGLTSLEQEQNLERERERVRSIPDINIAAIYADDGVDWPYGSGDRPKTEYEVG